MRGIGRVLFPFLAVAGTAIALFFLYSLLFQGESLISSPRGPWIDTGPPIWINWSTAEIVNRMTASGGFPLWSHDVGIGVPLLADPHLSFLSPFSIILYLLPNSYGWDLMILLKAVLAMVFAYALALRLGLSVWFSVWSAVLYGFSGHVFQFLHHFHTNSLVFAPLCLIAVIDLFEGRIRRGIVLAATSLPLMVFGGGLLDIMLLALLLIFVSCSYILLGDGEFQKSLMERLHSSIFAATTLVICITIAAIWIVPYLELRQVSVPPRPDRSAAYYSDIWYLFGQFLKNRMPAGAEYSHWFMKQIQYLAILALPGFWAGFYRTLTRPSRYRYLYVGFLALMLLQLGKLYGFAPLQFINQVPLLQDIRYEKYTGLYTLGFYLIAAYGYQELFRGERGAGRMVLLLSTVLVLGLIFAYTRVNGLVWSLELTIYLCLAVYPLVVWWVYQTRSTSMSWSNTLLILLSSGVVLWQLSIDTNTHFDKRLELFQNDALVAGAREVSDTQRYFPIAGSGPRTWSAEGLNDVRDISVMHTARYHRFFKNIVEKEKACWHRFVLCSSRANKVYLEGLRWIGVDTLILDESQLSMLDDNPDADWTYAGSYEGYHFVNLHGVEPLVRVVGNPRYLDEEPGIDQVLQDVQSDQHVAYLEGVEIDQRTRAQSVDWQIDSYKRVGTNAHIEVTSNQPAFLVISEQYYPGWKATVSGQKAKRYRANYLFQAVAIPAGTSIVKLEYRPYSLSAGAVLSIFAILLLFWLYSRNDRTA